MSQRNLHKRVTHEDKFDRKWWVNNEAKRIWVKWVKHTNNKMFRKKIRQYDDK